MSDGCKSCSAEIIWAVTVKGKRMPVDAVPVADGNLHLIRDDSGAITAHVATPPDPGETWPRHRSHFSTCANAASHRRPR